MLTRLEVSGFKNLVDFSLDFGPFTCLAGPSGVGKSNILEVIGFLSRLTRFPINDAALRVRNIGQNAGSVADLFSYVGGARADRMELAAEMIVDRQVWDDAGREGEASSSFLRYEVSFGYQSPAIAGSRKGALVLQREALRPITEGRAGRHLKFPHSKNRFRDGAVFNNRHARAGYISTHTDPVSLQPVVSVHQDGRAQGKIGPSPASAAFRTLIGTENTIATPTILAAKHEMSSWQVMALDPAAMRHPDPFAQPPGLGPDGSHLPATLRALSDAVDPGDHRSGGLRREIAGLVSAAVPVKNVKLVEDETRQLLSLEIEEPSGLTLRGASIPDTVLRLLALAALSRVEGGFVTCLEEPENGVDPAQLTAVNSLLHQLAVDPYEPVSSYNRLRQVIVTTHSPFLAQLQIPDDLVLAALRQDTSASGEACDRLLECVPCKETWRCSDEQEGISPPSLLAHLMPPETTQIAFPGRFWT